HQLIFDADLCKRILHVDSVHFRLLDDSGFAGQGVASAEAIDLPLVGASHDVEQEAVPKHTVLRHFLEINEYSFAGSAAHDGNRYFHRMNHLSENSIASKIRVW